MFPYWPETRRDLPASASQILRLKACVTMPVCVSCKRPVRRKLFLQCLPLHGGFTLSITKPRHCSLSLVRIYRRLFLELWAWRGTKLQNFGKYLWGSWLLSPTESRNRVCRALDGMAFHHGKSRWKLYSYLNDSSNSGTGSGCDRYYREGRGQSTQFSLSKSHTALL